MHTNKKEGQPQSHSPRDESVTPWQPQVAGEKCILLGEAGHKEGHSTAPKTFVWKVLTC